MASLSKLRGKKRHKVIAASLWAAGNDTSGGGDDGGGGGTTPDLAIIDFKNGVYEIGGVTSTVGDMITGFDGTVTPGSGLGPAGSGYWNLATAVVDAVKTGATVIFKVANDPVMHGHGDVQLEWYDDPDYSTDYLIGQNIIRDYNSSRYDFPYNDEIDDLTVHVACTVVPGDRLVFSRAGLPDQTISDIVLTGAINAIALAAAPVTDGFIESIRFIAPVSDADLPALSTLS